ncbi:hypothetical protein DIPPA_22294 [Diplonema papillatum]|nr:hypothetical protein DIPPA_22294 [Diplonema papillatum]|eukprot:gene14641-22392_t
MPLDFSVADLEAEAESMLHGTLRLAATEFWAIRVVDSMRRSKGCAREEDAVLAWLRGRAAGPAAAPPRAGATGRLVLVTPSFRTGSMRFESAAATALAPPGNRKRGGTCLFALVSDLLVATELHGVSLLAPAEYCASFLEFFASISDRRPAAAAELLAAPCGPWTRIAPSGSPPRGRSARPPVDGCPPWLALLAHYCREAPDDAGTLRAVCLAVGADGEASPLELLLARGAAGAVAGAAAAAAACLARRLRKELGQALPHHGTCPPLRALCAALRRLLGVAAGSFPASVSRAVFDERVLPLVLEAAAAGSARWFLEFSSVLSVATATHGPVPAFCHLSLLRLTERVKGGAAAAELPDDALAVVCGLAALCCGAPLHAYEVESAFDAACKGTGVLSARELFCDQQHAAVELLRAFKSLDSLQLDALGEYCFARLQGS